MSIQVLPGDSPPPSVLRKSEVSSLVFSITDRADRISSTDTFLVFAAVFSNFTHSSTSYNTLTTRNANKIEEAEREVNNFGILLNGSVPKERARNQSQIKVKAETRASNGMGVYSARFSSVSDNNWRWRNLVFFIKGSSSFCSEAILGKSTMERGLSDVGGMSMARSFAREYRGPDG